ncbi:MAG: hypothetical protein AAF681_15315, partial [Pseudomonadota bacterium]
PNTLSFDQPEPDIFRASADEEASAPTLDVSVEIEKGGEINVKFTDPFPGPSPWVTLVAKDAPGAAYGQYFYTRGQVSGEFSFNTLAPGDYEVRFHTSESSSAPMAVAPISILSTADQDQIRAPQTDTDQGQEAEAQALTLNVESDVALGAAIEVSFNDPLPGPNPWLTIVEAGSAGNAYQEYFYTNKQTSGEFTFKGLRPGKYELRYHASSDSLAAIAVVEITVGTPVNAGAHSDRADRNGHKGDTGLWREIAADDLGQVFAFTISEGIGLKFSCGAKARTVRLTVDPPLDVVPGPDRSDTKMVVRFPLTGARSYEMRKIGESAFAMDLEISSPLVQNFVFGRGTEIREVGGDWRARNMRAAGLPEFISRLQTDCPPSAQVVAQTAEEAVERTFSDAAMQKAKRIVSNPDCVLPSDRRLCEDPVVKVKLEQRVEAAAAALFRQPAEFEIVDDALSAEWPCRRDFQCIVDHLDNRIAFWDSLFLPLAPEAVTAAPGFNCAGVLHPTRQLLCTSRELGTRHANLTSDIASLAQELEGYPLLGSRDMLEVLDYEKSLVRQCAADPGCISRVQDRIRNQVAAIRNFHNQEVAATIARAESAERDRIRAARLVEHDKSLLGSDTYTPFEVIEAHGGRESYDYFDATFSGRGVDDWGDRPDGTFLENRDDLDAWYMLTREFSLFRSGGFDPVFRVSRAWADYEGVRYKATEGRFIHRMLGQLMADVLYSVEVVADDGSKNVISFEVQVPYSGRISNFMIRAGWGAPTKRMRIVDEANDFLLAKSAQRLQPSFKLLENPLVLSGSPEVTPLLQAFMEGDFDLAELALRENARNVGGAMGDVQLSSGPFQGSSASIATRTLEDTRFARLIANYALVRVVVHGDCGEATVPIQQTTTTWTEYTNMLGHYRGSSAPTTRTTSADVPARLRLAFLSVNTVEMDTRTFDQIAEIVEQIGCDHPSRQALEENMAAFYEERPPVYRIGS